MILEGVPREKEWNHLREHEQGGLQGAEQGGARRAMGMGRSVMKCQELRGGGAKV